jgi:prepilin-type N-terminal cleavage/methylation domain-containing protein
MLTSLSFNTNSPFIMSSTTRRHNKLKAFTIIESLVVLTILAVLTMVLTALFFHHKEPEPSQASEIVAPISSSAPNTSPEVTPTE